MVWLSDQVQERACAVMPEGVSGAMLLCAPTKPMCYWKDTRSCKLKRWPSSWLVSKWPIVAAGFTHRNKCDSWADAIHG